jgi:hypothetical protein
MKKKMISGRATPVKSKGDIRLIIEQVECRCKAVQTEGEYVQRPLAGSTHI